MNGKTPHIVQYQGSKRLLAPQILRYMPRRFNRLVEPFAGMAAVSIAAACADKAARFHVNDLNAPLVALLREAVNNPQRLIDDYSALWAQQFSYEERHTEHFYAVRERFNSGETTPANMLYLLARCVKGSVRYGKDGKFNQSPDKRRHGVRPQTLAGNVRLVSQLLRGRTSFSALDYHEVLDTATPGDLVYMDPPYQGVSETRDRRYLAGVPYGEFAEALAALDCRGVDYLVSYDGACGGREYGVELPRSLRCRRVKLSAGRSTQATLLGRNETTLESLYVSDALMPVCGSQECQLSLWGSSI